MARILLAEDDQSLMNFLLMALSRAGHEVTVKKDGLEALETLDSDTEFDLLLTDIVMPGMDGIALARLATDKCPDLKIMFITGFAGVAIGRNQRNTPNARVLSKPFHLKNLVEQVDLLLAA